MIRDYISLMRPKQWYKNLVLLLGSFFSNNLSNIETYPILILGFVSFCLISGAVYSINDIRDAEHDKNHPTKNKRPIACGKVTKKQGFILATFLTIGAFTISYKLNFMFFITILGYFLLNILYTYIFKNVIIADVFLLASFFVIRAISGIALLLNTGAVFSPWFTVVIFQLALLLGFEKRMNEKHVMNSADKSRPVLKEYNEGLLSQYIIVSYSILIVFYSLFTFVISTQMMITIPIVMFGLFRYHYIVQNTKISDPLLAIINDTPLLICILLWSLISTYIYYFIGM
jgi:4-hydroxybenzoate polyprenyltransferase